MKHRPIITALAGCLALAVADASCSDDGSEFVPCKNYDECGGGSVGGGHGAGGSGAGPSVATWVSVYGDGNQQFASSVATDSKGNIYVGGYYTGAVDFGGVILPAISGGIYDIFVVKLDTTGKPLWAMPFGQTGGAPFGASEIHLAVDSSDHLVVGGQVIGTTVIGLSNQVTYQQNGSEPELFVASLDGDGAVQWAQHLADGSEQPVLTGLALDASDNVFISGQLKGNNAQFGGFSFVPGDYGVAVVFIAMLDAASGAVHWITPWGHSTGGVIAGGLGVGPTGNATAVGSFKNTLHTQGGDIDSTGQDVADIFVIAADASGGERWVKRYGDAVGIQNCQAAVSDSEGTTYLTGGYTGDLDFGSGVLTSPLAGKLDIYVAAIDEAGKGVWAVSYQAQGTQGFAIDIDDQGTLAVTGGYQGTVPFLSPALSAIANTDLFVLALDTSGVATWVQGIGGAADQFGLGVSIGPSGEVNFVGRINGDVELPDQILTHAGGDDILVGQVTP